MSLLDEQQPPPPTPLPSSPFGIGFRQPAAPPSSPRLPSPSSSPESQPPTTDEPAWDSGTEYDDSDQDESPDPTPPPASSPDSDPEAVKVELFSDEELAALTRGGIAAAGEKAHDMFATTPGQVAVDLYKTTEADQANIGNPLAAIASRHQGIGGKVNPDTKDALSMMVGLVGYATRQINLRNQARAIDAGAAPTQAVDL